MRLKKCIIILTATICVVSLVFVAVYQRYGKAFVADILIGIFSSSFLAFLVSILEYANERRETMEKFYSAALEAIHVINQYRVDYDLDVAIDRVLLIKNYDYSDLDNAYGALKFLFRDKRTKKYIFEKIYDPICQLHNELVEPCHHLSLYKDGVTKNKEVAKANVEKATELLADCKNKLNFFSPKSIWRPRPRAEGALAPSCWLQSTVGAGGQGRQPERLP